MEGPRKSIERRQKGGGEKSIALLGATNTPTVREREREREMIADAFFAFLSWLRLLFFNREMELALIGTTTTTTTTILVFYSDVYCRPFI